MTLAEILKLDFEGNFAADHDAFKLVDAFVRDETQTYGSRAVALYFLVAVGMGEVEEADKDYAMPAEDLVKLYLEETK